MSREFKIGDDVEWVRYGGLFGIDGFRCNGTIVGFGLIGEYLWCTVYVGLMVAHELIDALYYMLIDLLENDLIHLKSNDSIKGI